MDEGNMADFSAALGITAVNISVNNHGTADVVAEHQVKCIFHVVIGPGLRKNRGIGIII